ncbi:MAG: hypothetical protein LBD78_02455 [Spirochaetaceae bacterium]|jgi:predicted nucleic acid-binding Zn ribbon protein|nr:hypothetical protein [Spirochaetaceae bacterium]
MDSLIQLFAFTIIGIFLLWFGYTLFFRPGKNRKIRIAKKERPTLADVAEGSPGAPKTCPVCSALLKYGERVHSSAFPGIPGQPRIMHISGCIYCLDGERPRRCPVCGATLEGGEYLIARMFDRPGRSHVHVLGCSRCKGPPSGRNSS